MQKKSNLQQLYAIWKRKENFQKGERFHLIPLDTFSPSLCISSWICEYSLSTLRVFWVYASTNSAFSRHFIHNLLSRTWNRCGIGEWGNLVCRVVALQILPPFPIPSPACFAHSTWFVFSCSLVFQP